MIQESAEAEARGAVGWGVLRLVRNWPSDGAEYEDSPEVWPSETTPDRTEPTRLTLLPPPEAPFDRRAATVALWQVLAEWRIGARELDRLDEGSHEWFRTWAQVTALRDAYHRLFREIRGSATP